MKITKNTVPSVTYQLTVNGEVVDQANAENPLFFLYGVGQMLPDFEKNIDGLEVGAKFNFDVSAEDGYGQPDENQIFQLPVDNFAIEGKVPHDHLTVGAILPMQDQDGNPFNGKVIDKDDEFVTMDFNHPLAGKDLHFEGEIIAVREANEDELSHGHAHGADGTVAH